MVVCFLVLIIINSLCFLFFYNDSGLNGKIKKIIFYKFFDKVKVGKNIEFKYKICYCF